MEYNKSTLRMALLSHPYAVFHAHIPAFGADNRAETKFCVHIFMNSGITVKMTFTLQIDFHAPVAVNSIVRMIYFPNLCLDFGFMGMIICLPVFPVVVISILAYTQPSKQPANTKFIMILFNESISL